MEQPSLTAFVVSLAMLSIREQPAWAELIPEDAARLYAACTEEASRSRTLFRWLRGLSPATRMALMDRMVAYGFPLHIALRKKTIEAHARRAIEHGSTQLVVIGSGFDSLALRLSRELPALRCFELDRPETIALKRRAIARAEFPEPANLSFVACDLGTMPLHEALGKTPGFQDHVPTFYVAEGLTMYLTEQQNRELFSAVRACSTHQCTLAFTAIEALSTVSKLGGALRDRLMSRHDPKFSWCISRSEVDSYLRDLGLTLESVDTYQQLQFDFRSVSERRRLQRVSGEHVYVARGS